MLHKRFNILMLYSVKTFDVSESFEKSKKEATSHL